MMVEPNRYEDQPFGLPPLTIDNIRRFLMGWPEIERIEIFGSRAMGNYRYNSDIDICVWGEAIDPDLFSRIRSGLQDLPIPYKIDVVQYETISHPPFKAHIDEHGVDFFKALKMGRGE
ncbi:MAG TPA: nucleotidyltransferase domain-containing protein [Alphaproteobacteria bacterium]|nr:nucleotidyltransferase domain-containing protein [Alphaproteobacteria bacterium]USO04733.1 MAG: nucleotidyltransferase domain-containing protein [Rhodospirillales bacterium]HOO81244.1 nucleotidyltransferase domain-containing protein [Alphaproteobacteria bacterium]